MKKLTAPTTACGILFILTIVFFAKNLFFSPGTFIGGVDVIGSFYWNEMFVKESFLSGSIPLWNPYYYCGHPFLANPSPFTFYPATLFYVFLPLPLAFSIDTVLHVFAAAMGMFFFVRTVTSSTKAGLASAIVYSLSGYFMERIAAGHVPLIHAAALVPWIFYFTEKALKADRVRNLVLAGIFLGLQILGGDPHISYLTSLFLALYFLLRVMLDQRPVPMNGRMKGLSFFLLIPLIAFGISAIQVLPSMEFRSLSDRTSNTFEFVSQGSFSPAQFFLLLVPKPMTSMLASDWETACYVGILSLFLAFIGLFFSRNKKYALCTGIMLFIAITFILGSYTPLYYLYYKLLPMLSTFRIPARATVIVDFLMSLLAGLGLCHIAEYSLSRAQKSIIVGSCAVVFCILFLGAWKMRIPLSSKEMISAILFLVCSLALLSTLFSVKNKESIARLFIAFLFIDLYLVYSPLIPRLSEKSLLKEMPFEQVFKEDPGQYRVAVPGYGPGQYGLPSRGVKGHYHGINGSTPIILKDYFDFIYGMATITPPELFRHTFAQDLFQNNGAAFSSKILGVKYAIVETPSGYLMTRADWHMPRAALVENSIISPRKEDHLAYMKDPQFDPLKTIILEKGIRPYTQELTSENGKPHAGETVRIRNYEPNRIDLEVRSPSHAFLLLSELYCPGWKAYVDGKKEEVLRADYVLRAVRVPTGEHSVSFVYRPGSFFQGLALTLITLFSLPVLWLVYYKRKGA